MTDILFIHPNASSKIYQELAKDFSAIEPPIWAGMLAKTCIAHGHRVELIDCEALRLSDHDVIPMIEYYKPRLICFVVYGQQPSASTQNMEGATSLSALIRQRLPQYKIMFIGGHVAALPYETLKNHPEIDFVATNEGVYALLELLKVDMNKPHEFSGIQGLMGRLYNLGYTIPYGSPRLVEESKLSIDLPGVAWDRFPLEKYRTALWHSYSNNCDQSNFAAIYTSLGCPYSCKFCMINAPFGKSSFRYWNPDFTIQELDKLAKYGIKNLKIADEMFVLNPSHFLKLCNLIIERGYKFNIWCYARVDTVKPEYLEVMKKAGINWIGLGIESANKRVRTDAIKGRFDDFDIKKVVKTIQSYGIHVAANYIFGLPEDDHESMQETLLLAIDNNTEMANFYCAMAYPGSQLYKQAVKEGWKLPDSYVGYSQHSYECQPLPTKYISAKEVLAYRDQAWMIYHKNPFYLSMIKNKFGEQAELKTIESTKIRLKRKLLGD